MAEFNFQMNEIVLCFHGPLLYEAKILKTEYRDHASASQTTGPHYFVHYKGWNDKWDEWVPEPRLLKNTEENLNRQKSLTSTMRSSRKLAPGASDTKKLAKKSSGFAEHEDETKLEMRLSFSDALKAILVNDWENVTKSQMILKLPASPTVTQIMASFMQWGLEREPLEFSDRQKMEEISTGIKDYMDFALGTILLYTFERFQYKDIRSQFPHESMSDIYGSVHLLRLIVKMPAIMAQLNFGQESLEILSNSFDLLLKLSAWLDNFYRFLDVERSRLFLTDAYEYAHSEYITRAKNI